ncbi:MAG: hypothetical protein KAI97_02030 [Gemmatimonadetes bacterium]|nr:hypothetical protein [Gemmatimonadota bacterium]
MPGRPDLLFIPVSGPVGAGEYVRCLTIAQASKQRWPAARIRFVINRNAPYAESVPFETHRIDCSPTLAGAALNEILSSDPPNLAIFDNAGRYSHLRHAHKLGIRIVYISSRPKQRWRAFRPRALRLLDQHWIGFPKFIDGGLGPWERVKLQLVGNVEIVFLQTVFPESLTPGREGLRQRLEISDENYVLFVPGGGGKKPGSGPQAPQIFTEVADRVSASTGVTCLVVSGPNYRETHPDNPRIKIVPTVSSTEMIDLIHDAHLLVINGGTTLVHGLAHEKVCITVPLAHDQRRRIKRCKRRELVVAAQLNTDDLCRSIISILDDSDRYLAIQRRVNALEVTNGASRAVEALERLVRDPR